MSDDTLSMHQAAEAVGRSYDRFRKIWRDLVLLDGFPAPVHGRVWLRGAVEAWRVGQSMRAVQPGRMPRARLATSQQPQMVLTDQRRVERDRRTLEQLRTS